jgi:hypothetical protein
MAMTYVLPSASYNGVGVLDLCISRLNTRPVRAPVERFTAVLAGVGA